MREIEVDYSDVGQEIDIEKALNRLIGASELLSTEEERNLLVSMYEGRKASEVLERLNGSRGKEIVEKKKQARIKIKKGKIAHDKLVMSNLRFVAESARRRVGRGVEFVDLFSEGMLGLLRSLERFDPVKYQNKLGAYAVAWIDRYIDRAVHNQGRSVRLPIYTGKRAAVVYATGKDLEWELGRKATEDELANRLNMSWEKVRHYQRIYQLPLSLNYKIDRNGEVELGEIMEDFVNIRPEDAIVKLSEREYLVELLDCLPSEEREILRWRWGFADGEMKDLHQVANIMGVSFHHVKWKSKNAMARLRELAPRDQ